MRGERGARRLAALAAAAALSLLAPSARADVFSGSSGSIVGASVDAGGVDGASSESNRLTGAAGGVTFSTSSSAGNVARGGALQTRSFPSPAGSPAVVTLSSTSLSLSFTSPGYDGGVGALQPGSLFRVQADTAAADPFSFAAAQISISTQGPVSGDSQQVQLSSLMPNSTYYLRVFTRDADGDVSPLSAGATAATLASPAAGPAFKGVFATSITVTWVPLPSSPPQASSRTAEGYRLEASSTNFGALTPGGDVVSSATVNVALSTLTVKGLLVGTTYYFRLATLSWDGGPDYILAGSTLTLVSDVPPTGTTVVDVASTTLSVGWTPVQSDLGYLVQASTASNFTGTLASTSPASGSASAAVLTALRPNTTYYLRVGSLWGDQTTFYAAVSTISTLAPPLSGLAYRSVYYSSATLTWPPLPSSPPDASSKTAEGYFVEASSTNFGALYAGGTILSSRTPNVALSTLTVSGLIPDTTYFFRVSSLNWGSRSNATALASTATLASPPNAGAPPVTGVFVTSASASWDAGAPANPAGTVYRLQASSTSFQAGTVVVSSLTLNLGDVVTGLLPDTTYALRVTVLNPSNVASSTTLSASTSTLAFPPDFPSIGAVYQSSAALSWASVTSQGYRVEASSTGFGALLPGGASLSSATTNGAASALTVPSLAANTTYYFRVASLNWASAPDYADAGSAVTPAALLSGVQLFGVFQTSVTVNWQRLPASPQSSTAEGYRLQASTAPDFSGTIISSETGNVALSTLTIAGLSADATYYFRAGALNWAASAGYGAVFATSTLAAPPSPSFAAVYQTSATLTWTPVTGQGYELDASLSSTFAAVIASTTVNPAAASLTAPGLSADTTYFFRVGSLNWTSRRAYAVLGATATLAAAPVSPAYPANGVFFTSATVQWTAVTSQGYELDASTASDFSGDLFSSATSNGASTKLVVSGLDTNTVYYLRVGALNWDSAPNWAVLASTRTRSSPKTWTGATSRLWNTATNWSPSGVPGPNDSVTINVAGSVSAAGTAIYFSSLTIGSPAGGVAANLTLSTAVNHGGDVVVYRGAGLTLATSQQISLGGDFTLVSGSTLSQTGTGAVDLSVAGIFNVQGGATIAAAGFGYAGGAAQKAGAGSGAGGGTSVNNTGGGGGGHGGAGSGGTGGSGGGANDNPLSPSDFGSGGGGGRISGTSGRTGGAGGGLVIVGAPTMYLNGYIDASGSDGGSGTGSGGGGAGGGVNLSADVFAGTGTIVARGGAGGDSLGGGGGGGLVSVDVNVSGSVCGLSFDVSGGTGTASSGGGGIVSSTTTLAAPAAFTGVNPSTYSVNWSWSPSNGATGYQLFSSTGGAGESPVLSAQTASYVTYGLLANTTAAFFVRALSCGGSSDSAAASVATLSTAPVAGSRPLIAASSSSVTAAWPRLASSPQELSSEGYRVEASTDSLFRGLVFSSSAYSVAQSTLAPQSLWPNTTYFLRAASLNWAGTAGLFTSLGSTSTLASPLGNARFLGVFGTSVTAVWTALPSSPPDASSMTAEGYRLDLSTAADFSGALFSSTTPNVKLSTLTIAGLASETTYYARAAALNWLQLPAYVSLGSIVTVDTTPPSALTDLAALTASSTTLSLSWTAPGNNGATGCAPGGAFLIDYASYTAYAFSTSTFKATVAGSFCPGDPEAQALGSLLPNTTYFVRVYARDAALNTAPLSNGATAVTLATPLTTLPKTFLGVFSSSVTAAWARLPSSPPDASSKTAEGYRVEASSTNFGSLSSGGVLFSSTTAAVAQSTLTITGLSSNATYYFRVAALGWDGQAQYTTLGSTLTTVNLGAPPSAVAVASVWSSSVALAWAAVNSDGGYVAQASTAANFTGTVASSATSDGTAQQLAVPGLLPNTTYFLRVGALWGAATNYASSLSTPTAPTPPADLAVASVYFTSMTVSWTALPSSPPDASSKTAEGYLLQASTAADFTGTLVSSSTRNPAVAALSVAGLSGNTTYYLRLGSIGWSGAAGFGLLDPLATLASLPGAGAPPFSGVFRTSMTAQWTTGSPPNPAGTRYSLEASSTAFAAGTPVLSSKTFNVFGTLSGLIPNTTYTLRVAAFNYQGLRSETPLGSTSTLTNLPTAASPAFPAVYETSASVSWTALPASPPDASSKTAEGYSVEASSTDFGALSPGGVLYSSATAGTMSALTVSGLDRNTTYYFRVGARNWNSAASTLSLGSTTTLPSPLAGVSLAAVYQTSAALTWTALPASPQASTAEGYRLEASTAADFTGTLLSSATASLAANTLTVAGLSPDTTYFLRVGAVNWDGLSNPGAALSTSTLAAVPGAPAVSAVYVTSAAFSWTGVSSQGYELDASLSAAFATVLSSITTDAGQTTLTVPGLSADTTYFFRVGSINWTGRRQYADGGSASTLAQAPGSPAFVNKGVYVSSAAVQWSAVTSQGYVVDASTASDFSGELVSTATPNAAAVALTDLGLNSGTTYYFRVGSLNWGSAPNYVLVGSTRTSLSPKTWTGATSRLWNVATNWNPSGVPGANDSVTIGLAGSVDASGTAISFSSLTIGVPAGGIAANLTLSTTVKSGGSIVVYPSAGLTLGTSQTIALDGDVVLVAGSTLTHRANGSTLKSVVSLSLTGLFDLQAGATMTAVGAGYAGGAVNVAGSGPGAGGGTSINNTGGGGGGHGGAGSLGTGGSGGSANDSATDPTQPGSGGGGGRTSAGSGAAGGAGGGLLAVAASEIRLNGYVDVSGGDGGSGSGSGGGGAGGGVNLSATVFSGTGTVVARGGSGGDTLGGGGGGGRVSVEISGSGSACGVAYDVSGGTGTSSSGGAGTLSSTSTLTSAVFSGVAATTGSITWQWTSVQGALSYQIFSSTGGNGESPLLSPPAAGYTTEGLAANTTATFYVRASACGSFADSPAADYATLAQTPQALAQSFPAASSSTLTAAWAASPSAPAGASAEGYRVEASTDSGFAGLVFSSITYARAASTLTLSGLWPNTTYFVRVAALNWSGASGSTFTALGSTPTLAGPATALAQTFLAVYETSATVAWAALPASPPEASSRTCEGYLLQVSTAADFSGAVGSSSTFSLAATTLTVSGVDLGTTNYVRLGTLNHAGAADFASLAALNLQVLVSSTGLSFGTLDASVVSSSVSISSIVVTNVGSLPVTLTLRGSTETLPSSPWSLGAAPGDETVLLQGLWNGSAPPGTSFATAILTSTTTSGGSGGPYAGDQNGAAVPVGETRTLWLRFSRPTSTVSSAKESLRVHVRAVYP